MEATSTMTANSVLRARAFFLVLALCYGVGLDLVYTNFVAPIFSYQGMIVQEIPLALALLRVALAVLPVPFLPLELRKPSEFQVILLYAIVYVPSVMVGYHIVDPGMWGGYSLYLATTAVGLIVLSQVRFLPPLRIPRLGGSELDLYAAFLLLTLMAYGGLVAFYGMPDNLFDVAGIYLSRADFKERAAEVPALVNYLYWWQGVVVNPILIIAGLLRRNIAMFTIGVGLELMLFALTTLRSMLLSVLFCIFMVFFLRSALKQKALKFVLLMTIAMGSFSVLMAGEGFVSLATRLFVQRWLAIQGQLSGAYFDFFSVNAKAQLGNSFLSGWVSYPYGELSPGEVIGDNYVSFGSKVISNATANFWADAFAQFGFVGVIGATLVAFVLLWIVDSALRAYPRGIAVMLFSTCALSLVEQGVQMALLTGGFIPLLLIGLAGHRLLTKDKHGSKAYRSLDLRS